MQGDFVGVEREHYKVSVSVADSANTFLDPDPNIGSVNDM
jgi:hypothetical protein